jgi:hypothetical protein
VSVRLSLPWLGDLAGHALNFLAALLVTTLSFASFASAHTDNVTVLHLTAVQVEDQVVDVAPTGPQPSLGDQDVFGENLFRDGHKVGVSGGVCTFVRVEHPHSPFSAWSPQPMSCWPTPSPRHSPSP